MKPRARRVTLAAAAIGVGVIALAVILNWSTVRNHVEAWHFQLTRETARLSPVWRGRPREIEGVKHLITQFRRSPPSERTEEVYYYSVVDVLRLVADCSGSPVIVDSALIISEHSVQLIGPHRITADFAPGCLRQAGYRVLEQRFPRRAYVVMLDKHAE